MIRLNYKQLAFLKKIGGTRFYSVVSPWNGPNTNLNRIYRFLFGKILKDYASFQFQFTDMNNFLFVYYIILSISPLIVLHLSLQVQ